MGTIKTKFQLGQKVWSIQDNQIQELEVSRVEFYTRYYDDEKNIDTKIVYGLGFNWVDDYKDTVYKNVPEHKIFRTKNELIKSFK